MEDSQTCWLREELVPAQLVLGIQDAVRVRVLRNADGTLNLDRYAKLSQIKTTKSLADASRAFYNDVCGTDEELFEVYNYVSVLVCQNSLCINGKHTISFGATIHAWALLPSNAHSLEDSFVLSVGDETTIVVRVCQVDHDNYDVIVLDMIDFDFSQIVSNSTGTKVVGTSFFKTTSLFNVEYSPLGFPLLDLQQNIVTPANILGACILNISETDDAFVSVAHSFDKITHVDCYSNLANAGRANLNYKGHIMKNTFELPLFVIPLANTKAVMFLQSSGFTIKGACFLITGSGDDQTTIRYPSAFKLDNYYVPNKTLSVFSDSCSNSPSYAHDQVLVSSSPNNAVFLIDVFFNHAKGGLRASMRKLFSLSVPFSVFSLNSHGARQYKMTMASLHGHIESRIVEFHNKSDVQGNDSSAFVLKYTDKVFSVSNVLPVVDFCLVENPKFNVSNEYPQQELWCSAGQGINYRLVNLRRGFVAEKKRISSSLPEMDMIAMIPHNGVTYAFLSRTNGSCIGSVEFTDEAMDLEESQRAVWGSIAFVGAYDENPTIDIYPMSDGRVVRVFANKVLLNQLGSFDQVATLNVEEGVLSSTLHENVLYIFTQTGIKGWTIGSDFQSVELSLNSTLKANLVTMLKVVNIRGQLYLFVGYLNSFLVFKLGETATLESTINFSNMQLPTHIISIDLDRYLVTSADGFYAVVTFDVHHAQWKTLEVKISNMSPLRIAGHDGNTVFLLGDQLWRLDLSSSVYCRPVLVDESRSRPIASASLLNKSSNGHSFLVSRADGFARINVGSSEGTLVRSFKIQSPVVRMFYVKCEQVMALVPVIDRQAPHYETQAKLLWFDVKTRKELSCSDSVLESNEYVQCVGEVELETGSGKLARRVLLGCRVEGSIHSGSVKICNLKVIDGKATLEMLYSWSEDEPITCIAAKGTNTILYSGGCELRQRRHNPASRKLEPSETNVVLPSLIKRFVVAGKTVLLVTANDSFQVCDADTFESLQTGDGNQYLGDSHMCATQEGHEIVLGDAQRCSLNITTATETTLSYKVDSFPRIAPTSTFGSWLTYDDRKQLSSHASFITVGMGGQVDAFTSIDKNNFDLLNKPSTTIRGSVSHTRHTWIGKNQRVLNTAAIGDIQTITNGFTVCLHNTMF